MMIFFLYIPIFISLSLSFLLDLFKKYIHFFLLDLATTFNITTTINNYKLHPNSSTTIVHVLDFPPPPKQIGFSDNIDQGLMACTKSLDFQSIEINDEIDANDNNNDDDEDDYWRKMEMFPPPLSSLNGNGQPSFILVPMRENGRLQLNKVRIKRPEFLCAVRQDGRLRLFLVPDHCVEDDAKEQEHEQEEQELVDEFEVEEKMEEEELKVESTEENEKDVEVVEETTSYEQKDVRIGEWKFPNERFRNCHQVMNHIQSYHHVHGNHHHLHIYGLSIA